MSDAPLGPPEPRVVLVADGAAAERYREELRGPFEVTVEPSATDSLLAAEYVDVILLEGTSTTTDRLLNYPDHRKKPVPLIGVLTETPTPKEGSFDRRGQAIATPIDGTRLRERVTCLALRARYHRTLQELARVVDRLVELKSEGRPTTLANEFDPRELRRRKERLERRTRKHLTVLADLGCLRSLYADLEAISDGRPIIDRIEPE